MTDTTKLFDPPRFRPDQDMVAETVAELTRYGSEARLAFVLSYVRDAVQSLGAAHRTDGHLNQETPDWCGACFEHGWALAALEALDIAEAATRWQNATT